MQMKIVISVLKESFLRRKSKFPEFEALIYQETKSGVSVMLEEEYSAIF